jgi:hypothetical protein
MITPLLNDCGVSGCVGKLMAIFACAVHTPFTDIVSPPCTSESCITPSVLILCILMSTPFLNSAIVIWPIPLKNFTSIAAACEVLVTSATNTERVSFLDFFAAFFFVAITFFLLPTLVRFRLPVFIIHSSIQNGRYRSILLSS